MFKKVMKYEGKKKVSFDLTEDNYTTLSDYAKSAYTSNSFVVNVLISRFLNIPEYIKDTFAKACLDALKKERAAYSYLDEFEQEKADERIYTYQYFLSFFGGETFALKQKPAMKKVELQDGHAFIPHNWIELEVEEEKTGNYIGVVEVRNAKSYFAIPHFYFLSKEPINTITAEKSKKIYELCTEKFPDFKKIMAMQVEPIYDENNVVLNQDLWAKAPIVGIFSLLEYGTSDTYPFNAMIVRDDK